MKKDITEAIVSVRIVTLFYCNEFFFELITKATPAKDDKKDKRIEKDRKKKKSD